MLYLKQIIWTLADMHRQVGTADTPSVTDTERTRRKTTALTDRVVRALPAPSKGNKITYDARPFGFGIRVTAAGNRSFVLNYRFKGRERRITIGEYPTWSVIAARRQAEEYRVDIANGRDPLERRISQRDAPTVQDMWERYTKDYLPKRAKRAQQDQAAMYRKSIGPKLGKKKVADVTFNDCERLHRFLTEDRPIRANRVLEVLRRNFNLAIKWGWVDRNPVSGIEWNPEQRRERYLSHDEIEALLNALDEHHQRTSCDIIRFMLFTGCRRGEALAARWDQFDSDMKIWTKPAATTKQRRAHRVPVSTEATKILSGRRMSSTSEYVFTHQSGEPIKDIKKTWASVTAKAKISNIRLHDLRHTFASIAVSQGQSLPIIGAMLGHTQSQTTLRYAHLYDAVVTKAVEDIAIEICKG